MKVLFVTNSIAAFNTGDTIYSYGIIDRIADSVAIDILTYNEPLDNDFGHYHQRLSQKVNKIYRVNMKKTDFIAKYVKYHATFLRYSKAMCNKIDELLKKGEYSIVIIDHLRMSFVLGTIRKYDVKVVLVQHNIETQNHNELLKLKGRWKYFLKNISLPKIESKCLKDIQNIWCITESDMRYFCRLPYMEDKNIQVVQPFFPYQRIKYDYGLTKRIVITGSMNWYPNIEGVLWFVEKVFSKLVELDSEYKLYIVGRNPDEKILNLNSQSIIVTGSVPSVDSYLVESDLLLVPNKLGGGAKIKIIEGVLKGIPTIVLRPSITGYENLVPDASFVVDDEEEYLSAILSINCDEERKSEFVEMFIENAIKQSRLAHIIESTI